MAKRIMKQTLLVTLVLGILALGMASALAEGAADQKLQVCYYGGLGNHSRLVQQIENPIVATGAEFSIDTGASTFDLSSALWLILYGHDCDTSVVLPDEPVPQAVVFVNSIIVPVGSEKKIKKSLLELSKEITRKGAPVYFYGTALSNDDEEYRITASEIFISLFKEYLEEMSADPESGVIKSDEDENLFLLSLEDEETGEKSVGYVYTYIVEVADKFTGETASERTHEAEELTIKAAGEKVIELITDYKAE